MHNNDQRLRQQLVEGNDVTGFQFIQSKPDKSSKSISEILQDERHSLLSCYKTKTIVGDDAENTVSYTAVTHRITGS